MNEYNMDDVYKRQSVAKLSNDIVVMLEKFIPEACRHEAEYYLNNELLNNNIELMDNNTKAKLKWYEENTIKFNLPLSNGES